MALPPLKVDADAAADADDDGQVGIWKAPLPGGTAELKSYWGVSEIGTSPPPLKVDADDADDDADGQVGIWKAPLPDGTAELKSCLKSTLGQVGVGSNITQNHSSTL